MNFDEVYAHFMVAAKMSGEVMPGAAPADILIEDSEGNLLEIEKIYFSVVGGGQIRIKALVYDDEFNESDASAPDPDVEL